VLSELESEPHQPETPYPWLVLGVVGRLGVAGKLGVVGLLGVVGRIGLESGAELSHWPSFELDQLIL
jgi:hypothetical protein